MTTASRSREMQMTPTFKNKEVNSDNVRTRCRHEKLEWYQHEMLSSDFKTAHQSHSDRQTLGPSLSFGESSMFSKLKSEQDMFVLHSTMIASLCLWFGRLKLCQHGYRSNNNLPGSLPKDGDSNR